MNTTTILNHSTNEPTGKVKSSRSKGDRKKFLTIVLICLVTGLFVSKMLEIGKIEMMEFNLMIAEVKSEEEARIAKFQGWCDDCREKHPGDEMECFAICDPECIRHDNCLQD